jgi:integrase
MTGHIRARSAGSFELRYRVGGKTITTTVKGNKRDAQRRLRELLTLADQGRHPDDPERLTVGKWLDRWLDIVKSELAAQTHANYETTARTRIAPALGSIQLSRLAPSHLQAFYTAVSASGLKPSSAAHVCIVLNIALSRAVELRLIATHPGEPVKKRKPRTVPKTDHAVLGRDQCSKLLAAAKGSDLYPMILIGLATGMRRNEILALQWKSIDFENTEIAVDQSIVRLAGSTSRKLPKNGKRRVVSLPENIIIELRRLKREQAEGLLRLGVRQDGATEVCRRGGDGAMRTPLSVTSAFGRLAKRIGLPAATFHGLRHAHASELLRAGVPVHIAADRLGHSDGGMLLLKTYAHVTPDAARDAAKRIGSMFDNL